MNREQLLADARRIGKELRMTDTIRNLPKEKDYYDTWLLPDGVRVKRIPDGTITNEAGDKI